MWGGREGKSKEIEGEKKVEGGRQLMRVKERRMRSRTGDKKRRDSEEEMK